MYCFDCYWLSLWWNLKNALLIFLCDMLCMPNIPLVLCEGWDSSFGARMPCWLLDTACRDRVCGCLMCGWVWACMSYLTLNRQSLIIGSCGILLLSFHRWCVCKIRDGVCELWCGPTTIALSALYKARLHLWGDLTETIRQMHILVIEYIVCSV